MATSSENVAIHPPRDTDRLATLPPASDRETGALAARVIAFYLPQFHPIPENDLWWGRGFTEWTNVAKARPLFPGHYQPRVPADLGFYDLRVPEVRAAQAALAKAHGVEAFCYWHYWFAGDRLLERPFQEVLDSGEPDFPFCLGWANQSWTGIWHGAPDRILKEQTYPGTADHVAHFETVLPALRDPRYCRVDGMPLFVIFRPTELPNLKEFVTLWRDLALAEGLKGVYFAGMTDDAAWNPNEAGLDASVIASFLRAAGGARRGPRARLTRRLRRRPTVYRYERMRPERVFPGGPTDFQWHPCVFPNWDNTPRSGVHGRVLDGSTPELFRSQVADAIRRVAEDPADRRLVFVKSWNEWAEGNHLEPDLRFGNGYLEVLGAELRRGSPTPRASHQPTSWAIPLR